MSLFPKKVECSFKANLACFSKLAFVQASLGSEYVPKQ